MTKASDNLFPKVILNEAATDGSDFSNPSADYRVLFLGEDGELHLKDSSGTVTDVSGAGGDVATDAIWDAAGDLAVGSGANTAARLAKGADGTVLTMVSGALAWANAPQTGIATRTAGDITTSSTSFVDMSDMSVTITTGAHRCLVFFSGSGNTSANAGNIAVDLNIDGSRKGQDYGLVLGSMERSSTYTINHNLSFQYLTPVLTAASHTFKIQWRVDSGTGTMFASSGVTPIILTVIETALTA